MSCFYTLLVNCLEIRKAHLFRKRALKQAVGDHSVIAYRSMNKKILLELWRLFSFVAVGWEKKSKCYFSLPSFDLMFGDKHVILPKLFNCHSKFSSSFYLSSTKTFLCLRHHWHLTVSALWCRSIKRRLQRRAVNTGLRSLFSWDLQIALWIISRGSDTSMWKWVQYKSITLKAQRFSKNPKIYRHH